MARKIFISSDMSVDERLMDIAEKDMKAGLIWPWLLTAFDDWGRADASPRRLKALVFPMMDTITTADIANAIQLYADGGLIECYEVDGKSFMAIEPDKWFRYQTHVRSEKRDKDGSRYPANPSADNTQQEDLRANARNDAQERASHARALPSPSPSLSPTLSPTPSPTEEACADAPQPRAKKGGRFVAPSLDEVSLWFSENDQPTEMGRDFWEFYASKGWKVGNASMTDWRIAASRWIRNQPSFARGSPGGAKNGNGNGNRGTMRDLKAEAAASLERIGWKPD